MTTTVLITGANRGIGLALTQYYANENAKVIAVCRNPSDELKNMDVQIISQIDVTSEESIKVLKSNLQDTTVDILINNAGILRSEALDSLNYENMLEQFKVNTLGPIRVVEALIEQLTTGSKIAFITSRMGSLEDNASGGAYGYRMSKCALNAAGKSMSIDLKSRGISVALLHPGYVKTEMVNFGGLISAEQSAKDLGQRINELCIENTGTFWHSNGEVLPW